MRNTSHMDEPMETILNNNMRAAVLPVTVFVGVEAVLGFLGNIIIIHVYLFYYHACNFKYFVLCLACVDITSTLTTIPGEMFTQLNWYIYPEPVICKVKSFFNVFTVCSEALCLLTIAVDRYRKICRPLEWQIQPRGAITMCCLTFVIAAVIASPVTLLWGTRDYKTIDDARVTVCEKDEEYLNTPYPLVYSISLEVLISVCLTIMFVLYVYVARALFKRKAKSVSRSPLCAHRELHIITNNEKIEGNQDTRENALAVDKDCASNSHDNEKETDIDTPAIVVNNNNTDTLLPKSAILENIDTGATTCFVSHDKFTTSIKSIHPKVRRKTLIMLILTVVFIVTTVLYLTLLSLIARSDDVLQKMTNSERAIYFFFFRLYFINHVINPVVYGLLDPQFKQAIQHMKNRWKCEF